jgi:hypothetical protein
MTRVFVWAVIAVIALAPLPASADGIVAGPPAASYYAPPAPACGPAPVVSYYGPPTPAPTVTTYRYGLLGLRTMTTTSYYPPVVSPPVIMPALRPRVVFYGPVYP